MTKSLIDKKIDWIFKRRDDFYEENNHASEEDEEADIRQAMKDIARAMINESQEVVEVDDIFIDSFKRIKGQTFATYHVYDAYKDITGEDYQSN